MNTKSSLNTHVINPSFVIGSSIIVVVLSTVIFLLDNPIKYVLFIFALPLTGLLYLKLFKQSYKIKFALPASIKFADYFLIACSIFVLACNIFSSALVTICFVPSVIVSFFLPGWILLRLLGINGVLKSSIALLVLSFSISIGLSALIYMATLPFKTGSFSILPAATYVAMSFSPMLKQKYYKSKISTGSDSHRSCDQREYDLIDILLVIWMTVFFIFVISTLYPLLSFLPGSDIVRHFSDSEKLINTPDLYSADYPWFHFVWADVLNLSSPPMWLFQTGIAFLSIVLLFSFYNMSKAYLRSIDQRAPIIATIMFSVFSGFGWFYFLQQHVLGNANPNDPFYLLTTSNGASYWDIGYGQSPWLWLWFRPLTIGFTLFFAQLSLMRSEGLSKLNYIMISSLLTLVLSQVHFPELVVFVAFLFVIALFFPAIRLRIKETSVAVIIGIIFSSLITIAIPRLLNSQYFSSNENLLIPLLLAGSAFLLSKYSRRPKISLRSNLAIVTSIALFVYLSVLFHWFLKPGSLVLNSVFNILAVPWQFYPLLLGISGVFAIPGIGLVAQRHRNQPIMIFVVLFFFIIIFGRLLTYINSNVEYTGYWERRLVPFVFVSSALLAPVTLLRLMDFLKQRHQILNRFKLAKNLLRVIILSFFVLGGTLSTYISLEYQIINAQKFTLTNKEIDFQSSLRNINAYSTVLTATDRSTSVAEYLNLGYLIGYYKFQLWPDKSPELPLRVLSVLNRSSIIYLNGEDRQLVNNIYGSGYLATHLLKVIPAIREGPNGSGVFQAPRLTPPSSISDMILVLPGSGDNSNSYYAYDILSTGGYNYTTAPISDIASISKAKVVVAPTEEIAAQLMQDKKEYNLHYNKLIVLNTNGYGPLTHITKDRFSRADDNNGSSGWKPSGISNGRIGIPKLTNGTNNSSNLHTTIASDNSLTINVGQGKYSLWQISKQYAKSLNVSKFDSVNFDWYGRGDGKWYVLQLFSGPNQSYWYRFQDNWIGWKQVILPLQAPDGRSYANGITFDKVSGRGASWSKITSIDFRTEASNINEAGKFYLGQLRFSSTLSASGVKLPSTNNDTLLPTYVPLYSIVPIWRNYNVTAYYHDKKDGIAIPFTLIKQYPGFDIIYVNVEPIIQKMNSDTNPSRPFYPILGKLLESENFKLPKYNVSNTNIRSLVTGHVTAFNNATFIGDLSFRSSSAIVSVQENSSIKFYVDGRELRLFNVSNITPVNADSITIKSKTGGVIHGGYGFYTNVLLNQSVTNFKGHPAVLSISSGSGVQNTTVKNIITGNKIQLSLGRTSVLLRQPVVSSSGIAYFPNFYAYGELFNNIRSAGQSLRVEGKTSFNTRYSDEFTIAHNTSLEGKLTHFPPIYRYDELGNLYDIFGLPNMRHIMTLAFIFFILGVYGFRKEKTKQVGFQSKN